MRLILAECFREDLRAQSLNFYSWVPSEANIDAPSRGEVVKLLAGGAVRVPPRLPSAVSLA
eukprot:4513576-Amphidinium_carterae.1